MTQGHIINHIKLCLLIVSWLCIVAHAQSDEFNLTALEKGWIAQQRILVFKGESNWSEPTLLLSQAREIVSVEEENIGYRKGMGIPRLSETDYKLYFGTIAVFLVIVVILYFYTRKLSKEIVRRKASEAALHKLNNKLSNYDRLTTLPNRNRFNLYFKAAIRDNPEKCDIALLLVGLDLFKVVNDTLGHDKGDELLVEVAHRIRGTLGPNGIASRLGGDEFVLVIPNIENLQYLEQVANLLLDQIAKPFIVSEDEIYISASIGITLFPKDGISIVTLLKNADHAMYAAKSAGRNRFCYFTEQMNRAALERIQINNDLRVALLNDEFEIHYQPIVDCHSGEIHKAEALIRWRHPKWGIVSPNKFIHLAEESGLICEIGDWAFRQAAYQARLWRESHAIDFQISVNTSPLQYLESGINVSSWADILASLGLPGDAIVAEITEGLLLDAADVIKEKLLDLQRFGIQVAIDDFGTGYSSLSYIRDFSIDYLKIDKSFIVNLTQDSDDYALCEVIILMGHKLGLKVIAEGIETEAQHTLLAGLGLDYGQGYFYAKPAPAEEIEALLYLCETSANETY